MAETKPLPPCTMPGPIPTVACSCFGCEEWCSCAETEKALRAGIALTAEQREWCLNEIGSVEGHRREDHEADDDKQLGRSVINAWIDYCHDKGLM